MTGTGPASAVYTIHDKELKAAQDPREVRRSLEASYSEKGSVYREAAAFGVDDIIEPPETGRALIAGLEIACGKQAHQLGRKMPLFP